MKKTFAAVLCAVLLVGLVAATVYLSRKDENIANAGTSVNAPTVKTALNYQGTDYPLKKHIQTILLIGTDSTEEYAETPEEDRNFYSYHQADFLMLLVLDRDAETARVIQLNRDTMTDVPWLDVFGEYGGTEYKQLCLAFNYGDGGAVSCKNTVRAVSSLLFDLPIHAYIQLPMTAIPQLNDLVGGVSVTIAEDMTAVDPDFTEGSTIRLTGAQAEGFVRARKVLADDTNIARMRRQREYLDSFIKCTEDALQSDPLFSVRVLDTLGNVLQTNLTDTQMSNLLQELEKFDIAPIAFSDGTLKTGAKYYEFYVNESSLWEIVKNICCA